MSGRMRWCESPGQIELDHSDAEGLIRGYQQVAIPIDGNILSDRCSYDACNGRLDRADAPLRFPLLRTQEGRDKRVDATKLDHAMLVECNHIRSPRRSRIGVAVGKYGILHVLTASFDTGAT